MAQEAPPSSVSGTSRAGTHGAASLTWIDMAAIAAALRERHVREGFLIGNIVGIHAVADGEEPGSRGKAAPVESLQGAVAPQRMPATARAEMSVTSSETRRPLG